MRKNCSRDREFFLHWRLKAVKVKLQNLWDHKNNSFKQWKASTVFETQCFLTCSWRTIINQIFLYFSREVKIERVPFSWKSNLELDEQMIWQNCFISAVSSFRIPIVWNLTDEHLSRNNYYTFWVIQKWVVILTNFLNSVRFSVQGDKVNQNWRQFDKMISL